MQLQMPADSFSVYWAVGFRKELETKSRAEAVETTERKDGECDELSIRSDLGLLTTCQKHLPINICGVRACVCVCASVCGM